MPAILPNHAGALYIGRNTVAMPAILPDHAGALYIGRNTVAMPAIRLLTIEYVMCK